jgi:4-amino-4-deoxy-L-arabinose transferase-like glycosyltransferase
MRLPNLNSCFTWFSQSPVPPSLWILLLWFLLIVPAIGIRGAHYEEGTTIGLARGAFEDGHWLTPFLYGVRFAERPVLVSWLLGAMGTLTGYLPLWMARLPIVLALLAGAELVYWLVRQYASIRAAMFGAVCFLISPMMLQKTVTAEVDGVVSVLLFAGYVTWWVGHSRGGPKVMRWLLIAIILCAAALVKGPQPLGYFFIGIGSYLTLKRSWRELMMLAVCGVLSGTVAIAWYWYVHQRGDLEMWLAHSRIAAPVSAEAYLAGASHFAATVLLEWLPGLLLAAPLALDLIRREFPGNRALALALVLYAGACSLILVFWPSANGRYAMPSVLALAAAAGLAFDYLLARRRKTVEVAQAVAACLITYALVLNWLIMPLAPAIFHSSRRYGDSIALAMAQKPGTLYVTPEARCPNELVYVQSPVRIATLDTIQRVEPPFFAIVTHEQELLLASKNGRRMTRHFSFGRAPAIRCFNEILR